MGFKENRLVCRSSTSNLMLERVKPSYRCNKYLTYAEVEFNNCINIFHKTARKFMS